MIGITLHAEKIQLWQRNTDMIEHTDIMGDTNVSIVLGFPPVGW